MFGQHRGVDGKRGVFLRDSRFVNGQVVLPVEREVGRGVCARRDRGRVGVAGRVLIQGAFRADGRLFGDGGARGVVRAREGA